MLLHALKDDFNLVAPADTERSAGTVISSAFYLTDPSGNRLTDPSGNYLVGYAPETVYPQKLHSIQDDFRLNAE